MATKLVPFPSLNHVVVEDLERMFEYMGRLGWHPKPFGKLSRFVMAFTQGDTVDYRYVYDYPAAFSEPYRRHYEGYGWELVGRLGAAVIWRRPEREGVRSESFADKDHIELRNRRVYKNLGAGFISCTLLMALLTFLMYMVRTSTPALVVSLIFAGDLCVILLLVYCRKTLKKLELSERPPAPPAQ